MKKLIYFIFLSTLIGACSNEKQPNKETVATKESKPEMPAAKLEDLSKIDTGAFLKENPQVRNKLILGTDFQNLTTQKRIYSYKSRVYFGLNGRKEGTLAATIMSVFFQDSVAKANSKLVELKELKFPEGQSKLDGTDSEEMKIVSLATYVPTPFVLMLKINVNTNDLALRKERLNNFKQAMEKAGADITKFVFDENILPVLKEGTVSFEVNKIKK